MEMSVTEPTSPENGTGSAEKKPKKKFKISIPKKKRKLVIIIAAIVVIAAAVSSFFVVQHNQKGKNNQITMVKAERRSIQNTVTGSSSVEANDSYDVSAMVTGEVLTDNFNEGDKVVKDQVLYTIEADDAQNSVESAKNSIIKAQMSYEDAVYNNKDTSGELLKVKNTLLNAEQSLADTVRQLGSKDTEVQKAANSLEKAKRSYQEASDDMENLNIVSDCGGTVKEVFVKNGDNVSNGTKIAEVYNDTYMKLSVPFNTADADKISNGSGASVKIAGQSGEIYGTVTNVSSAEVSTASHAIVRYVTVEVKNPGALTTSDSASVTVNGISCQNTANFEYIDTSTITAKTQGKIYSTNIQANDKVYEGTVVVNMSSDSLGNTLANAALEMDSAEMSLRDTILKNDETAKNSEVQKAQRTLDEAKSSYEKTARSQSNSVKTAALELDNAKLQLDQANKKLENYTIKSPIEGTVVIKNVKAGDKLENSGNNSNTSQMAIIYDLSSLSFELAIDESSIRKVQVGQEVKITADAVEGEFKGVVEKVGVNGTASNGVTTYPVKVKIEEYGDLLPGMNVDASIVVESVENVVAIPVSAVNRGNVVYVKGDKTEENDHAPEGYKSVKIETGINDTDFIEVKSGLNEGDEIKGANSASGNETSGTAEAEAQMGGMPGGGGGGAPGGR
ncbi:MAG: HlyD family efflux transporter periplasmic adaptor subunit [bacterium]|nr:HlyD family efflux transporter periplasmic adaptor subunit [bacterium]